jgi:hypothetical protein
MILKIRVTPRAKKERIVAGEPLRVYVPAPPEDGRANDAVIKLLSERFGVSKSKIKISKGKKNRDKTIEIT